MADSGTFINYWILASLFGPLAPPDSVRHVQADTDDDDDLYGGAPLCARSIPLEPTDTYTCVLASTLIEAC